MNLLRSWIALGGALSPLVLSLVNRSIAALWLLAAVLLLRLLLRRAPKWVLFLLWGLLALRLALPLHINTSLSLLGSAPVPVNNAGQVEYLQQDAAVGKPQLVLRSPVGQAAATLEPVTIDTENVVCVAAPQALLAPLWLLGAAGMLLYALISSLRLRYRLREAIPLETIRMSGKAHLPDLSADSRIFRTAPLAPVASVWPPEGFGLILFGLKGALRRRRLRRAERPEDGIWLSDWVDAPFLLGLFSPRIYLPASLEPEYREPVLRHERAHLCHRDNWWKGLGWLLLCFFWFDPFLWLAWYLFGRDLELACDERVIRTCGEGERKAYASALLSCSIPRRAWLYAPLAFGESGIKTRLRAVMRGKKPARWLILPALMLVIAAAVFFATDPLGAVNGSAPVWEQPLLSPELDTAVCEAVLNQGQKLFRSGGYPTEAHAALDLQAEGEDVVLWVQYLYLELSWDGDMLAETGAMRTPARLRFQRTGEDFALTEFWQPGMDGDYARQLREQLPDTLPLSRADSQEWVMDMTRSCYAGAAEHFGIDMDALCERLFTALETAEGEDMREKIHRDPLSYRRLLYLGSYSAHWIIARFLEPDGQEGLRGDLLWRILSELDDSLGNSGAIRRETGGLYNPTGQLCFDAWLKNEVRNSEQAKGLPWMEEHQPIAAMALRMSRGEA